MRDAKKKLKLNEKLTWIEFRLCREYSLYRTESSWLIALKIRGLMGSITLSNTTN